MNAPPVLVWSVHTRTINPSSPGADGYLVPVETEGVVTHMRWRRNPSGKYVEPLLVVEWSNAIASTPGPTTDPYNAEAAAVRRLGAVIEDGVHPDDVKWR